jgi:hypothetical protein
MLVSSWVATQLTASQEGLSSMSEWVVSCHMPRVGFCLQTDLYSLCMFVIYNVFPLFKYPHFIRNCVVNECCKNSAHLRRWFCPHLMIRDFFRIIGQQDLVFHFMNSANLECIDICLFVIGLDIISRYLFRMLSGRLCYRVFLCCYLYTWR